MNRILQILNLLGILVLASLLAAQWQANRDLHHQAQDLETTRLAHEAQLADKEKALAGQQADLDQLKSRLAATTTERDGAQGELKTATASLKKAVAERDVLAAASKRDKALLAQQADQFQKELDQWQAAVKARDAALQEAGDTVNRIAAERNAGVEKYNTLVARFNALAREHEESAKKFNDLVAKYNAWVAEVKAIQSKAEKKAESGEANRPKLPGT